MIEIRKETVGQITAEDFMNLNQEQQDDVLFLMTEMQRRLLKVRLTTYESRKIQEAFRKKRQNASGCIPVATEECIRVYRIDELYVLSGDTPSEIARRVRELCCKKVAKVAAQHGINSQKELDRLSKYDRDATLVSNMRTAEEAVSYLHGMGYSAKN